jgi:hypothetical protein
LVVTTTPASLLPITIDLGPGNEHENRRWLFPLLKNIRMRDTLRPRSRPR